MAGQDKDGSKPHLSLDKVRRGATYAAPKRKMNAKPLRDDYAAHGTALLEQLAAALPHLPSPDADARIKLDGLRPGVLVALETLVPDSDRKGPSKIPLSFELPGQDVVILSSRRTEDRAEESIVFVPDDARATLTRRLQDYTNPGNRDRPHVAQFEKVERIASADTAKLFAPGTDFDAPAQRWWELWVRDIGTLPKALLSAARQFGLDVHEEQLLFPDTTVIFIHATARQALAFATRVPGAIEEIRPGLGTIEPFLVLGEGRVTQHDFVEDLAGRIIPAKSNAPTICVLDTGVAAAHPLLADGLAVALSVDDTWGVDDHYPHGGHGTSVASLALHGDLEHPMNDQRYLELTHTVESVKLLPPRGAPKTPPPSYGVVTQSAVGVVEVSRPDAARSFCLASCHLDADASRPSSWSGALDQIAAGTIGGALEGAKSAKDAPKRLVLVAAGNVMGGPANQVELGGPINDPAQAWNALTIGGYTTKIEMGEGADALNPLVGANERSPFSTTSHELPTDLLPIKPEVLFEAGNMAIDEEGNCEWHPGLSLLSAGNDVEAEPLVAFWATSAAVGVAGHFQGQLEAALPGYWPETYRALIVQSARWPEPIRRKLVGRGKKWTTGSKGDKIELLRQVGFGVPRLEGAIASAKNDFTMIAQGEIQPYAMGAGTAVYNEVHFYDLPWPKTALADLGDQAVTLKITLSYFIEPNLTGKGATRPETYRSFGLRFALKKRSESEEEFRARLSQLKLDGDVDVDEEDGDVDEEEGGGGEKDDAGSNWLLGPKAVSAGSLHCDLWRGKASDLVNHDAIAVHPAPGWWKSHLGKGRQDDSGRYALVLSIASDGVDIDLYAEASAVLVEKETSIQLETLIG